MSSTTEMGRALRFACILLWLATAVHHAHGQCDSFVLVTRAEWGARRARGSTPLHLPVNMTFVHHSAGSRCTDNATCIKIVRNIQKLHMDTNRWYDIGYNFLVGENGYVYEGRGWNNRGAHSPVYNSFAHGTCIMGDYSSRAPDKRALDATRALIQCGVDTGKILCGYELFGHRDGRCTECPGDVLYSIIKTWPRYGNRKIPVICSKPLATSAPESGPTPAPSVLPCSASSASRSCPWALALTVFALLAAVAARNERCDHSLH